MTELLYQTDSYLREFEAKVTGVGELGLALDRTAFYPGGGGQVPDKGMLIWDGVEHPVVALKKQGDTVWHKVEGEASATTNSLVGTRVTGKLDWEHRYQVMRTHTAFHILCGVIWRDYKASVTGGNMKALEGRMDFEFEHMTKDLVQEIEEKINVEVEAAREVKVAILPREEAFQIPDLIRTKINLLPHQITEVRTVEIVGLDLQADGGTHVANTREVGPIRITDYKSKGRINKRIKIALEG
jgi:misacylated tRNA(Ala) deacylase